MMVTAWIENCRFGFRAEEVKRKLARAEDAFRRTFGLDGVCWEVGTRQSLLFDFANNSTDCWSKTELFKGLKLFDKKIVIIVQNRCRELVLVVRCSTRLSSYINKVFFNYSTRFSELTLPKAQRPRGLSSSCQSNFLRSYHKSWSHFIFRIST